MRGVNNTGTGNDGTSDGMEIALLWSLELSLTIRQMPFAFMFREGSRVVFHC
jgi:hypothetical protein